MNNRISIRAVSLGDDLREIAPAARRSGFGGVQLDMVIGALSIAELSGSGFREVRHLLASANLEIDSLWLALPPDMLMNQGQHDRLLWMAKRAIDAAVGLGAGMCCMDLGRLPGVAQEAAAPPAVMPGSSLIIIPGPVAAKESEPQVSAEELTVWGSIDTIARELGGLADRAGIVMALSSELSSFASLARALSGAQCPWFGVDLDPVSVLRDRWGLERVLDAVGGSLRHVRGRDAIRGSSGRTQPAALGHGSTDWQQMEGLLSEGGYSGWVAVDSVDLPDRHGAAREAMGFLTVRR